VYAYRKPILGSDKFLALVSVVRCMECEKPRCVYSAQAISKMKPLGEHTKEEAIDCRYYFLDLDCVFSIAFDS
jgi:hypothetical protein